MFFTSLEDLQMNDFLSHVDDEQTGTGYVRDISYQDLIMDRVQNPIFIDQNYNPNPTSTAVRWLIPGLNLY